MGARVKTVADAVALFEELSGDFKTHVAEQAKTNSDVQKQIFDVRLEQKDQGTQIALAVQGISDIKTILEKRRIGWQIWVPVGLSAFFSGAGLIMAVFGK